MVHTRNEVIKKMLGIGLVLACAIAFMPLFGTADAHAAAAKKLSVKASAASIYTGKTATYKAATKPSKNAKNTKWSSSNKSIAKVSKSKAAKITVKGINPGKVTIKAKNGKKVVKKTLKVYKKLTDVMVEDITAKTDADEMTIGNTLKAMVSPSGASANYQWYRVNETTGDMTIIKSATKQTYTLTDADANSCMGVRVQGTGYYTGTQRFTYKTDVKGNLDITAAEVNDSSPQVGETLSIDTEPVDATAIYMWMADGKAITGATGETFTLTKDQLGKKISCVVTGTGLYRGLITTDQTDAVTENDWWSVSINSFDPDDYGAHAGDTLTAVFSPEAAAGSMTFQWSKDGIAIANAQGSTYTIPGDAEKGTKYSVAATPVENSGYIESDYNEDHITVLADISGASVTLSPTKPTTMTDTIAATVTMPDKTDVTSHCVYEWYLDKVDDSNSIWDDSGWADGKSLNLTDKYYDNNDDTISFIGHKIICVAKCKFDPDKPYYYDGSAASAATSAVTSPVGTCTISDIDYAAETVSAGDTLKAEATDENGDTLTEVTYQWYRDGSKVDGATGTTYTIPGADTNKGFYCAATGTGFYTGNAISNTLTTNNAKAPVRIFITNTEGGKTDLQNAFVGDTLYTATIPAAAKNYVTYQWYMNGAAINGATDAAYTPSEAGRYMVKATLNAAGQDIWNNGNIAISSNDVTVSAKINSLSLTIRNNADTPAATTNAYVGYTITASPTPAAAATGATYSWTRDNEGGTQVQSGSADTYTIKSEDVGHKIVCKITGSDSGNYANSSAAEKTIAVTYTVKSVIPAEAEAVPTVGEPFTFSGTVKDAAVKANDVPEADCTYTWAVNGTKVTSGEDGSYTPVAADFGKQLSCTVTGKLPNATGSATYAYEAAIAAGTFQVSGVSGASSYAAGDTLTAATDPAEAAATASFQWYRCAKTAAIATVQAAYNDAISAEPSEAKAISGAASASYTLTGDDVGQIVFCIVKAGKGYVLYGHPYTGTVAVFAK